MKPFIVFCTLLASATAAAQTPDPSGHWEGAIAAPWGEVAVVVDVAKSASDGFTGTFGNVAQNLKGLPFSTVTVDGRYIRLVLMADGGQQAFEGTFFADGRTMSGDFVTPMGSAPFSLTRTGDAQRFLPIASPRIGAELEGVWHGTLDVNGRQLRLVLTMANTGADGASGKVVSQDEGGIEVQLAIAQQASNVTLTIDQVGSSYAGTLNAAGTELTGRYRIQGTEFPLTFRRGAQ